MKYSVLCSDLDGTLLSSKDDVSDFTISEISKIKDKIDIVLVSARMPKSITYLQKRLQIEDQPIICYNGALILNGSQEISSTTIAVNHLANIHRMCDELGIKLGLYHKDDWYVEEISERVGKEIKYTHAMPVFENTSETLKRWEDSGIGAHKIMLMATKSSADSIMPRLLEKFNAYLHLYRSNNTLIEITPKPVSKLSAIQTLLKNKSLADVVAFGDNYNDIDMLQYAGCGVAVGNARDEVKAIADHTTLKNTQDGVAYFIQQHILI
ncbi:Cof-type HAD-IIB family hydrolase [Spongiimicrobium sp. 3-5]|uniref:Cof-type HAD-IIB family hydrolase n=1 Tax=Spongiimicrobium sp. 3-5 TaxID=3332596 RepID=UPI00397FB1AC